MKIDHAKLLRALLAKAYKMQDGDIDEILNSSADDAHEAAQTAILDKDAARITELKKPKDGQSFQDGYKKAKSEVLTQFEKDLREKYEIEDDKLIGVDLVEAVVAARSKGAKPKELTDDDVKRHPVYQSLDKATKKQIKDLETDYTGKLAEKDKESARNQTFSTVSEKVMEVFTALNPVIPGNPKVAANLQKTFLDRFRGFEYEIQDNGKRILVSKDGKLLEDGHGHSLDFDALIKEQAAELFEFKANNGGQNAGNGGKGGSGGTGGTGGAAGGASGGAPAKGYPAGWVVPKTFAELNTLVNDSTKPIAERLQAKDQWDTEHPDDAGQ